jgi:hypothetical protein
MRLMRRLAVLVFVAAAMAGRAPAAEIFYMDHDEVTAHYVGPVGPLVISGEIDAGDYGRLLQKIGADENRFLTQNRIILASNGGDVAEAIKIARLLQAMFTEVSVSPQAGPCVGACFLIYAAAAERAADAEHLIGLHRPRLLESVANSLPAADAAAMEERALSQVRAFLQDNDVPQDIQGSMLAPGSTGVQWLTARDAERLGGMSLSFRRFLVAHCAWNAALERDVSAGRRPFTDAVPMLTCRARSTPPLARKALHVALDAAPRQDEHKDVVRGAQTHRIVHP